MNRKWMALNRLVICVSCLFVLVVAFTATASAAPSIIAWNNNYTNNDSLMFLVPQGSVINFDITADEHIDTYTWQVNKANQDINSDTFTWTVPAEKDVWEIHVKVSNANGEVHQEWVVSTLSTDEAPDFFDYFSDGEMTGSRTTDPWGRTLPTWTEDAAPDLVTKRFIRAGASTIDINTASPNAPYGTYICWIRFYQYTHDNVQANYFYLYGDTDGESASLTSRHLTRDVHDYFHMYDNRLAKEGFRRLGRNSLCQAPAYDCIEDDAWHKITLIHTEDGFWYLYYDDELEPEKTDHNDLFDMTDEIRFLMSKTDTDCITVFKDKYLFPGTGRIEYGEYVSHWYWDTSGSKYTTYWSFPINRTGISVFGEATLQEIYETINNPSLFSYDGVIDGKPTYTCYTDLVLRQGSTLRMNDEKLLMHCNNDGEHIIRVKLGVHLNINNSIIDSANDYYYLWGFTSQPLMDCFQEDLMSTKQHDGSTNNNRMFLHYLHDGRIIIRNSIINNCGNFWLESPLELIIEDTEFTNLVQVNFGDYRTGSRAQVRQWPKERTNFSKSFGVWLAMDVVNYRIEDVKFSAKSDPVTIILMGGIDVVGEHYMRNVVLENANIEAKVGYKYAPHEGYDNHDINSRAMIVNPSTESFVAPDNERKELMPAYYLDVLVQDKNGNPVQGASVVVKNEIEPFREPPQNIKTMSRPVYTWNAVGTMSGGLLGEGGWYDKQIDVRKMVHPENLIDFLKIGKDDDSFGLLYEIIQAEPVDLLVNGIRNEEYDGQGRLTAFEYFILNSVKTPPYSWYRVEDITYDADNLITHYRKYGTGTTEHESHENLGDYIYQISYNYLNNVVSNYTVTRTASAGWPQGNDWTVSKEVNCAAITGVDGHTALPVDEENTFVIIGYMENLSGISEYAYNITVYKDGQTATMSGLDVDETWYRPNPNTPTKTVVCDFSTGICSITGISTGTISGNVTDIVNGAPIIGATVTDGTRSANTTESGIYTIANVPAGTYTVTASATGYENASHKNITISADSTTIVNFQLTPAADDIHPITTYIITPSPNTYGWNNITPVIVTLFRADSGGSVVDHTNYSTISEIGPWTTVTGDEPFDVTVTDEGDTTIWYYSVDTSTTPNIEPNRNVTVRIDTRPPAIFNVTNSSTTITWTTDEPATSQVEYGLNTGYGSITTIDTNLVTTHHVTLTGLFSDTPYHYRVKSMDVADNLAVSGDYYFTTPPTTETVGLWHFDEGDGPTALDSSGNDNDGTIHGASWTEGILNSSALRFDGVTDYVSIPDSPSLNPADEITIEAWVKTGTIPQLGWNKIIAKPYTSRTSPYQQYALTLNYDHFVFELNTEGTQSLVHSTVSLANNTWYHVAGTYDGSATRIYVNGEPNGTLPKSGAIAKYSTDVHIGAGIYSDAQTEYLNGTIDEVKILNIALSAEDIKADYEAGLAHNHAPLLSSIGDQSAIHTATTSFQITASDPDNDPLTFSAQNLPPGAHFHTNNQTFSWTPTYENVSWYRNIRFEVSDGQLTDTENITIFPRWDVDRNGVVNDDDRSQIAAHFEGPVSACEDCDVNLDGGINIIDYSLTGQHIDENWGVGIGITGVAISPESRTVAPGESFSVNISVTPDTGIAGMQFDLVFNASLVRVNSVLEGDLLKQNGTNTSFVDGTVDNTAGTITNVFGCVLGPYNVTAPGTFAIINMTAMESFGTSNLDLVDVIVSDPYGYATDVELAGGTVTVNEVSPAPLVVNLTNDTPTPQSVNLTWECSVPDVDYYTVYRNGIFLASTVNEYYNVTGLSPDTTYIFDVSATSDSVTGANASITVRTAKAITHGVTISQPANATTREGVNATYRLTITNTGNVPDTFALTVTNIDSASTAALDRTAMTLTAGESDIATLTVTSTTAGTYNVTVTAESPDASSTTGYIMTAVTDNMPPVISNPTADPPIIPDDTDNDPRWGEESQLNITATDDDGIESVTIDLSPIGGSPAQPMNHIGGNIWSVTTNASNGTAGFNGTAYTPHFLQITATDIHGNSNTSAGISLTIVKNGDVNSDGEVDYFGDVAHLIRYLRGAIGFDVTEGIADVTGDGVVNDSDVTYLTNHLHGAAGYEILH